MAGMFYSLEEVAKKLNKSEEQIKEIVRDGKLREFRDGANSLFKIDEVEALMVPGAEPAQLAGAEMSDTAGIDDFADIGTEDGEGDIDLSLIDEEISLKSRPDGDLASSGSDSDDLSLMPEESSQDISINPEISDEELSMLSGTDDDVFSGSLESNLGLEPDTGSSAGNLSEADEELSQADTISSDQDLNLAEETSSLSDELLPAEDELSLVADTESDQMLPGEQAKESLDDYSLASTGGSSLSDDTLDFGTASSGKSGVEEGDSFSGLAAGGEDEASLEEIEGDVNLDSFGSGSGLLDLSLQADDTSLGGILDEIYTPEGDHDSASIGGGSVMDVVAEADLVADSVAAVPSMTAGYVEPEPDTLSNALGYSMALSVLAVIYTAIVAVAAISGITVGIMDTIDSMIWYIVIGGMVAVLLIDGIAFMMGRPSSPKEKKVKPKKEKKPKAVKEKKPQKPKKEKKAKS